MGRSLPSRIVGIDFSGAADAGRRIWIAEGAVRGGFLHLHRCEDAMTRLGCQVSADASCAALVRFLRALGPAAVGCDFPFSLPRAMIAEASWPAFLRRFAACYLTAADFHGTTHRRWGEPHRPCDRAAKTPFAPTNLRLYRQTYHGIRDVLAPLIGSRDARALPLQAPRPGVPWLLECCPASALKRLGCYRPYKGVTAAHARQRQIILRSLEANGLASVPRALRRVLIGQAGGDALDSAAAAWIAFRAIHHPDGAAPDAAGWPPIEGYVYAGVPVPVRVSASKRLRRGRHRSAAQRKEKGSAR